MQILYEPSVGSDHVAPIINSDLLQDRGKKRFLFENMWRVKEGYGEVVKSLWS